MTDLLTTDEPTAPAALAQEYVVGGGFWWYRGVAARGLALPWAFDDVTQDFGPDLYDRMGYDAQIAACDVLMRAAILEDGVTLSPAVDEEGADGYEQAAEIVDFCEQNLEELDQPLDDTLWDQLACVGQGNRVVEIVYHEFDQSPLPGRACLRSLTVKPRERTVFVVDPYMRLYGLLAQELDGRYVLPGALIDPANTPNLLPREKFAIMTFRPRNNDPRGTSAWRPAYNPWWLKMQTWQEFLKYLAQFASPSIVGIAAPAAGTTTSPATGKQLSAVDALLERLLAFQNGTAIAIPNGADVKLLFSAGDGKAFLDAFSLYDRQIRMAITTQTLATGEGEHASRAQAGVHQDALDTLIRQAKRSACRMIRRDVLRNLIRYNYGDTLAALTPKVSLGETEATDIAGLMSAISQLETSGYLDPSQRPGVDRLLNLPPRLANVMTPPTSSAPAPGQMPMDDPQQGGAA
jgi:hypothetical protein